MYKLFFTFPSLLYFVLSIFYVFPSGLPQPADLVVVWVIALSLKFSRIKFFKGEIWLLFFFLYALLVNCIWAINLSSFALFMSNIYLLFNVLAYLVFRSLFWSESKYFRYAFMLVVNALFLELVFVFVGQGGVRSTGTFNNPNQLAYFSVCFTATALFMCTRLGLGIKWMTVVLALGWYLVLHSLSKAGIGAFLIFSSMLLYRLGPLKSLLVVMLFISILFIFDIPVMESAIYRMESIGQDHDDSLSGRGYDRIINEFQYVFFGAGEGEYTRHQSVWGGEIHSTFGTLLFSYGTVGLIIFSIFIYKAVVKRIGLIDSLIFLSPVFAYSATHNGLRFTPFWILLALLSPPSERGLFIKNET